MDCHLLAQGAAQLDEAGVQQPRLASLSQLGTGASPLPVATPRGDTEPVPRTLQDLADRVPGSLAEALDRLIESVEKGEDVDVDTLVDVGAVALRVNGRTESVKKVRRVRS